VILPLLLSLTTALATEPSSTSPSVQDPIAEQARAGRDRLFGTSPDHVRTIDTAPPRVPEEMFPGVFDAAPTPHWSRDLPGERVNAPSHAERARPVLVGARIYVGAAGGDALYALSRRTGTIEHRYPADGPVNAEPLVGTDRLWFTDTAGTTWCYTIQGELVWQRAGSAPRPTRPTLSGDLLFVRDVDDLLVALDVETGEQQWQYRRKADPSRISELTLYAAPEPVVAGDTLLVGFSDGALVALDRRSGDVRWDLSLGEGRYPDMVAPASHAGGTVFASGYLAPFVALDLRTSTVRWRVDVGAAAAATLTELDGGALLLHPGIDGVLRAIDPVAGDVRWSWDSGEGASLTRPTVTQAGVLIGGSGGTLALVDLATGELRWEWHQDYFLEGLSVAPDVNGRQVVFTTNAGRLYSMLVPQETPPSPAERRNTHNFELVYPKRDSWGRRR